MKARVSLAIIVVTGFLIFICCQFVSAIDAPHSASNNISCGDCHGETLLNSPFWGGSGSYDQLCLNCHRVSSGPYTETNAPLVKTHSSLTTSNKYGDWTWECRNCHDPHYQRQKNYKTTDAGRLYLATGTITSCVYNGNGTSTLTYSTITYKTGWDSTKLTAKTGDYRRTILFPNANKLGYNYPVKAIDTGAKTITVSGDATVYLYPPTTFAATYGQYIKDIMDISADGGGVNKPVKFLDQTGTNSFADGNSTYDGVCEVCHTQTNHFRYGGGVSEQNHENICEGVRTNCIRCHKHTNGFGHGGGGSETTCVNCHGHDNDWTDGPYSGTTVSHSTHTENDADDVRGPLLACSDCHDTSHFPCFKSGVDSNGDGAYNLSETNVCDDCHSPNGSFNGVNDAVIGAKDNWDQGAYQSGTYPTALRAGKEKWCAGCHDNVPSVVKGITAPDIVGNNTTYGYYLDTHANGTYGVSRKTVTYPKGECLHCHDVSQSGHGGQLFDTSVEFCLKCHDNTTTYATTAVKNRSYSYRAGNYSTDTLDSIKNAFTNPPSISSHKLSDIKTFINGKWGYDANSNACAACHNPHIAQGDPEHSDAAKSSGTRGYPVARPSEHSTNYNNLWGEAANEKMSNYTASYQAPYRSGGATYEPDGSAITNGSNLTDYATFCTDCHNTTYTTINSTPLGRNLRTIDWNTEKHGKGNGNAILILPYTTGSNYVLSCTDCHEPHGSTNIYLMRKEVNNGIVSVTTSGGFSYGGTEMASLCERCHGNTTAVATVHHNAITDCMVCHFYDGHTLYTPCTQCHYHGSTFTGYGYTNYPTF